MTKGNNILKYKFYYTVNLYTLIMYSSLHLVKQTLNITLPTTTPLPILFMCIIQWTQFPTIINVLAYAF